MSNKEVLNTIKSTVHSFLPDARVLLFGSRATGTSNKNSDYDLLVVTAKNYPPKVKMNWESKIHMALVDSIEAPFDVIFHSKEEVDVYKNYYGHIVRYAMRDGVEL